jgi:hypothetical protein
LGHCRWVQVQLDRLDILEIVGHSIHHHLGAGAVGSVAA